MSTLYLSSLENWYWLAQVDSGTMFDLGYFDVEEYAESHNIERIHFLDDNEIKD